MTWPTEPTKDHRHHHADATPDEEWIPFEYYSPKEYDRLPTAFRQKSNAADRGEFPPYPESWF